MTANDRLQALLILSRVVQDKTRLSYLFLHNQPPATPATKEICFGVCRHYFRLQAIAQAIAKKKPDSLQVWLLLLMGIYQLYFMRKPAHAVVNETVKLLGHVKKNWAKGFINATLRTFCRQEAAIIASLEASEDFIWSHPAWLQQHIQADWPQYWQEILSANDCRAPLSLRVNRMITTTDAYLERLQQLGIEANAQPYSGVGINLANPCDIEAIPGFAQGVVSIQDESAQLAVPLLRLQPKLRVLDACCAPGGKTCHILETEPNLAECVAVDVEAKRLQLVQSNLSRLHLQATLTCGDGLRPELWWDGKYFDRILLDAPCSATGIIRRQPDIKLLRSTEDIAALTILQAKLLASLWSLLAPGGLLVYATCSVLKVENEQQIANFLKTQLDAKFINETKIWGHNTGYGWQILPSSVNRNGSNGDGFFYSVLHKVE